jgi:hypothetical protein
VKSLRLNKKEIAIVREVERQLIDAGHEFHTLDAESGESVGLCWLTGQRATLYEPRLMYHEGYVRKPNDLMHHAWNTLNGKLVDIQLPVHFHGMHYVAKLYQPDKSYTSEQVRTAMLARGCWDWMDKTAPATLNAQMSA